MQAREIPAGLEHRFAYSICTLVSDMAEYEEMVAGFVRKGFTPDDCEYLYVDNRQGNVFDAYAGNNRLLQEAQGRYVILCHQDVVLLADGRSRLDGLLEELTLLDANWGVCGNAGMTRNGVVAIRITDPRNEDVGRGETFPVKVASLDENLMIVRREAALAFSHDLSGFHWYGSDLCIIADILGWTAYVIDFHLKHKSGGKIDGTFDLAKSKLQQKYARAFRPRWQYVVTKQPVYIASRFDSLFVTKAVRKALRTLRIGGGLL